MVVSAVSSRVAMVARYVVVPVAGGGATHQLQRGFTIGGSCPGALRRERQVSDSARVSGTHKLDVLGRRCAGEQHQPAHEAGEDQVEQTQRHVCDHARLSITAGHRLRRTSGTPQVWMWLSSIAWCRPISVSR